MELAMIVHNIRSTHNVGSILRTCDGFGAQKVYLTGYTPYPTQPNDNRLPHLSNKITAQIHKTALGAEKSVENVYMADVSKLIDQLTLDGYLILALEQARNSMLLTDFRPKDKKYALLLGEEVNGVDSKLLKKCDVILEIPMLGKKESFNVSVAAGIALYQLCSKR